MHLALLIHEKLLKLYFYLHVHSVCESVHIDRARPKCLLWAGGQSGFFGEWWIAARCSARVNAFQNEIDNKQFPSLWSFSNTHGNDQLNDEKKRKDKNSLSNGKNHRFIILLLLQMRFLLQVRWVRASKIYFISALRSHILFSHSLDFLGIIFSCRLISFTFNLCVYFVYVLDCVNWMEHAKKREKKEVCVFVGTLNSQF